MTDEMSYNRKPIPKSILVFGAAAHIGGPLASYIVREAPDVRLRLATRNADTARRLADAFPAAEVVIADYFDRESLEAAVAGMEGVFVITPGGTDERATMTNLVDALGKSASLHHLIRQVGLQPEANLRRVPPSQAMGLPVQHALAKQILDESGLPVTYLNCGATFMDNFLVLGMGKELQRSRRLVWPERLIPWIDPREVGEVAARLFLSDNHRHIGQFHTLNNGHDLMRFRDVAALMSEVWGEPIVHDSSKESFFEHYKHIGPRLPVLWDFFQYEQDNEVVWARNDFVELTLGRKPKTLKEWLLEHRDTILGSATAAA